MSMTFHSEFAVNAGPEAVFQVLSNLPLVAPMFPGASVGEVGEGGKYPGTLAVSLGPKKLTFTGLVGAQAGDDARSGVIEGTAKSNLRGTQMAVTLRYRLDPGASGTVVSIESEALLSGMLADFAKVGGKAVSDALLAQFAERLNAHFATAKPEQGITTTPPAQRLSVVRLLWQLLLQKLWPRRTV